MTTKDSSAPLIFAQPPVIERIEILNPFDPRQRLKTTLPWRPQQTLADLLPPAHPHAEWVASINGRPVLPDALAATHVLPGDFVVLSPVPQGGGSGKSVLRIVAMIAIAVLAPYAAAAMGAAIGVTSAVGISMLAAGITIAGSMLVNALLPIKPAQSNGSGLSSSPSYGLDGPKNVSAENIAQPVCYGTFRMGGNAIGIRTEPASYTLSDGKTGDTQDLYLLFNAGEGPIAGIDNILIDDKTPDQFTNLQLITATGTADQAPLGWFDAVYTPYSPNLTLTNQQWQTYTTTNIIDRFRLDLTAPGGLYCVDSNGTRHDVSVPVSAQYKRVGDTNWTDLPISYGVTLGNGAPLTNGSVQDGWITCQRDNAVRMYFNSPDLTPDHYDIRVMVNGNSLGNAATKPGWNKTITNQQQDRSQFSAFVDTIVWDQLVEIQNDQLSYKYTAYVAMKVTMGEQINNLPTVTYLNHGRLVQVWDKNTQQWVNQASSNPAWITLDMLTHPRYGGGMDLSRFDLNKWQEWADYCDANNLTFNGVIDTEQNLWDAAQYVLRCGHAQIVNVGTRYTVALEAPADPVMLFSVANIIDGSFEETWLPMTDRANEIEIDYFDQTDYYKQHTVKVYDAQSVASGDMPRTSNITLYGVVDATRAMQEGMLQLNLNRYVLQSVKFDVSIDALACTVGDVVLVQHDMPQWGYAGRLLSGSTTTQLNLDRPVPMTAAGSYQVLVLQDSVERVTGTVASVVGTTIMLNGYDGSQPVKRLQVAGVEYPVVSYFNGGVALENLPPFAAGASYTLWDTDVLDIVNVVAQDGDTETLTLASPLAVAPNAYAQFSFGPVEKVAKPFRVKSIDGSKDYQRTLNCIEYNASIYDLSGITAPPPNYSSLPQPVAQVTNLKVVEQEVLVGGVPVPQVRLSWDVADPTIKTAEVFLSTNNQPEVSLGTATTAITRQATIGDLLHFRVQAIDAMGNRAAANQNPTLDYVVLGKDTAPPGLTSLTATGDYFEINLAWAYATANDVAFVELWASIGSSDFSNAHLLTTVPYPATTYTHAGLMTGAWWYYWGRTCDVNGNYSDYYPLSTAPGVGAQVSSDAANLLDLLNQQITSDQLDQDLQTKIDAAAGPTQDMLDQMNQIETGADKTVETLIQNILNMNDQWNANRSQGHDITNISSTVGANKASFDDWVNTQTTTNQSVATEITTLQGNVGTNTAAITSIENLTVDAGSALMTKFSSLDASVSGNSGKIQDVENLSLDASTALMTKFTNLDASISGNTASIQNIENLSLDSTSALMTKLDSFNTSIGNNTAAINDVENLTLGTSTALMTRFTNLDATISNNDTKQTGNYNNIVTLKLDSTTALMTQLNSLQTSTNNNSAAITNEQTARANGDSANASSINTLTTTVNSNTSSIQTLQSTTNGMKAEYYVKTDVNGLVAGFGIYNNGATSQFIVNSDYFAVGKSGYGNKYPFIIGTVNGQQVVAMNKAFIVDAAVDTLQINGNAVTVPVYAGDSSVISGSGAFVTIAQCSITIPAGLTATIVAQASVAQGYPNGVGSTGTARLWIGGTLVFEATGSAAANTLALAGGLAVGSGTFTVQLQWMGSDANIQQGWKGLTAFAAKR